MPKLPQFIDNELLRSDSDAARVSSGSSGGGGGGNVGSGGGNANGVPFIQNHAVLIRSIQSFAAQLSILTNRMRSADGIVQNKVAYIVAQIYRNRLRLGVGQKLSPLTEALSGTHRPLSTLADHVIVKPASRGKPAVVTFEKGWFRRAWLLENGYMINAYAHPAIKARLFWIAQMKTGASNIFQILDQTNNGYWMVPARPHIHFINDRETRMLMHAFGQHTVFGTPLDPRAKSVVTNTKAASRGEFKLRGEREVSLDAVSI